jgi:serine phosphatase RsbU (regulator of sigma subunit)
VAREARLARVLEIAAVAQRALLPPVPDRLGSLNLAASYDSAQEEAHIGGDAYAAVPSPFGARLLLADARGHGLDAVQLAATILGAFRERAAERDDLGDLVRDLDRAVARAGAEEDFATAVVAEIADGTLRIAVAGHASPLLIRAGASVPLDPPHQALPLGWGVDPEPFTVPLLAGDRVLLYTDGATDARRPRDGSFFPLERLAVDCLADDSLQAGLMRLRAALARWTQGPATDDVTFLTVEYAPTDGEPAAGREQQHPAGGHRPDAS